MPRDGVTLLNASSIAEAYPDRWWVPSEELLQALEPGRALVKVLAIARDAEGGADLWEARAVWLEVEERASDQVGGTIIDSELDETGYGEGDHLTVALDRIFDISFLDSGGEPMFNAARAGFAVGKKVLVGVTVLSSDKADVIDRHSFAGTVASFDVSRGIELRLDDETSYWLPPDTRWLREAPPGEYRLRATGQTVVNPDYLATWSITQSVDSVARPDAQGFCPPGVDPTV